MLKVDSGHTILNLPAKDLWLLINHSPAFDPWMKGESYIEIIKRIAEQEGRDYAAVYEEADTIRRRIDGTPVEPVLLYQSKTHSRGFTNLDR